MFPCDSATKFISIDDLSKINKHKGYYTYFILNVAYIIEKAYELIFSFKKVLIKFLSSLN